jgi:type VI secretion system protein ImpF
LSVVATRPTSGTRTEIERTVQASLLDRLTDLEPNLSMDASMSRVSSARIFRGTVQRDVEALLNTRRTTIPAPDDCPEVRRSVHEFGLVDITGIPVGTKNGRDEILAAMQDAIERFEPRLSNARVTLGEGNTKATPELRFVLDATLLMDPDPERVVFDTVLEVTRGEYDVRGVDDPQVTTTGA